MRHRTGRGISYKWLMGLLLLVGALVASACAADDDEEEAAEEPAAEEEAPDDDDDEAAEEEEEPVDEAELVELEIAGFNPPSLGAFLPAVIDDQGFDQDYGFDISFVFTAPDAYNTEFAAGQYEVGNSAALLSEATRHNQGVDIQYLFNVYDFYGALLSTTDEVQSLEDLPGTTMAASTVTTNYVMFQWFADQQGVALDDVEVENTATPGLVAQALGARSDTVQLWEPAYSIATAQNPDLIDIDLGFESWEEVHGSPDIPYLGVAAHREWIDENEDLIEPLFELWQHTADWVNDNPEEAAVIIADSIEDGDPEPIEDMIRAPERLALNVVWAADVADEIRAVFEAGVDVDFLDRVPDDSLIYGLD